MVDALVKVNVGNACTSALSAHHSCQQKQRSNINKNPNFQNRKSHEDDHRVHFATIYDVLITQHFYIHTYIPLPPLPPQLNISKYLPNPHHAPMRLSPSKLPSSSYRYRKRAHRPTARIISTSATHKNTHTQPHIEPNPINTKSSNEENHEEKGTGGCEREREREGAGQVGERVGWETHEAPPSTTRFAPVM